jgi:hypothetical protein
VSRLERSFLPKQSMYRQCGQDQPRPKKRDVSECLIAAALPSLVVLVIMLDEEEPRFAGAG